MNADNNITLTAAGLGAAATLGAAALTLGAAVTLGAALALGAAVAFGAALTLGAALTTTFFAATTLGALRQWSCMEWRVEGGGGTDVIIVVVGEDRRGGRGGSLLRDGQAAGHRGRSSSCTEFGGRKRSFDADTSRHQCDIAPGGDRIALGSDKL